MMSWNEETMQGLGEREAAIMAWLWAHDAAATVREVHTAIQDTAPLAYTTVMTMMDNLHRKGFLHRTPGPRSAYLYQPSCTREQYAVRLMQDALRDAGDEPIALAQFVAALSGTQADALRSALRRKASRKRHET